MNVRVKKIFSNKAARVNRTKAGNAVIFLVLSVYALYSLLPMVLAVNQAFKPLGELFLYPPRLFVSNPTGDNFRSLFELMSSTWVPFSRYIFNTVFITAAGTLGNVLLASMCAYPLAKNNVPGGRVIFSLIVYSLMISPAVADIANYQTLTALRMVDTYWAIIIPAFGTTLGLYIMKQFMSQIPDSLLEAAKIDGAGEARILFSVVMPNVRPAWLTLSIFSFQNLWNGTHSTYIYSEELKSLPYALSQIVTGGLVRAGAGAAVSVIMMVVPIVFFIFTQSSIIETMSTSGMKE